jgi:phage/plasmid-like protein (TIGR03299 family)
VLLSELGQVAPQQETVPQEVPPTPEPAVPDTTTPRMSGVSYGNEFSSYANRRLPWAGGAAKLKEAGKLLNVQAPTMRQALRPAGLDWTVDLVPLYAPNLGDGDANVPVPHRSGVQRSDNGSIVGVVGDRYEPVQNRRLAEFTDLLVDTGKSSLAGMGEAYGGSKVYSIVKMDGDLSIPGMPDEGIGGFLIAQNSHDGSTALTVSVIGIRWACTNGLISTVPGIAHKVSVRHTGNVEAKMKEAHRIMATATGYLNKLELLVPKMLAQPVTAVQATQMVEELVPVPQATGDNERAVNNALRTQSDILSNWKHSDNLNDIRYTAWGFHNAIVEWDQHTSRTRRKRTRTPMERFMTDQQSALVPRSLKLLAVA